MELNLSHGSPDSICNSKGVLSSWHDLLVEPLATDAGFATVLSPDATFQQVFAAAAASQQVAADDPAAQRRKISIKF